MKMAVGAFVLAVSTSIVFAQSTTPRGGARSAPPAPAADKAAVEKTIIATEQKINDAFGKGDAAGFKALVADDAWGIDEMMGVSPVSQMAGMLKPGAVKITDMKLENFKTIWIDANTAVLTYTWTGKGTFMDMPVKSPTYASTVYTKRGDKWVPVFHQETPKSAMPMPAKK